MTPDLPVCLECGGPLPEPVQVRRPRRYCGPACRQRHWRAVGLAMLAEGQPKLPDFARRPPQSAAPMTLARIGSDPDDQSVSPTRETSTASRAW